MGIWSHIIKGNDFTLDIISEYNKLYNSEVSPIDIRIKLEEEYCPIDDNEYSNFWTAVALCQWECGQLEEYVLDKVKQSIKNGNGLNYLLEEDKSFFSEREKELERFIDKIKKEKRIIRKPKKKLDTKVPSGTVYSFKLPYNLGYGYAKYIDYKSEFKTPQVSRIIQVFDYRTEERIDNICALKNKEYLFGPRVLFKLPNTRGKDAWKIIGNFLSEKDLEYPIFITSRADGWLLDDYSKNSGLDYDSIPFEKVKHLETAVLSIPELLITRTVMTFLKNSKKTSMIRELYDFDEDFIKKCYDDTMLKPKYSDIPDKYKKRPLKISLIDKIKKHFTRAKLR